MIRNCIVHLLVLILLPFMCLYSALLSIYYTIKEGCFGMYHLIDMVLAEHLKWK